MKKTRKSIIENGLDKAISKWRKEGCDRGAYEYIDDFFASLDFPADYVYRSEADDDYLTIAFLNETGKISFADFNF